LQNMLSFLALLSIMSAARSCNTQEDCQSGHYCRKPLYQLCCGVEGVCTRRTGVFDDDSDYSLSSCSSCSAEEYDVTRDDSVVDLENSASRSISSRPISPSMPIAKQPDSEEEERTPDIAFSPFKTSLISEWDKDGLESRPIRSPGADSYSSKGTRGLGHERNMVEFNSIRYPSLVPKVGTGLAQAGGDWAPSPIGGRIVTRVNDEGSDASGGGWSFGGMRKCLRERKI
jgi:hypothetical protein